MEKEKKAIRTGHWIRQAFSDSEIGQILRNALYFILIGQSLHLMVYH